MLLDALITPGHTFGPTMDEMLQRSHCAHESMKELVRLLPKQPPPGCKPAANWRPQRPTQPAAAAANGDVRNWAANTRHFNWEPSGLLASVHNRRLGDYYRSNTLFTAVQAWSPSLSGVTATSVTDTQDSTVVSQEVAALLQKQAIRSLRKGSTPVQAWSPSLSGVTATSVTDTQDSTVVSQEVAALLQKQAIRSLRKGSTPVSSTGRGNTELAEATVKCLPSARPAPAVSGENQAGPGQGAPSSPLLAQDSDAAPERPAVETAETLQPAQSGTGDLMASRPIEPAALGLAPERLHLSRLGLYRVIDTVQNANAPPC
ncbi:UNVERIFIED_CONTAM: hypothetical protein FKN15_038569 [Acipenser sinensis]